MSTRASRLWGDRRENLSFPDRLEGRRHDVHGIPEEQSREEREEEQMRILSPDPFSIILPLFPSNDGDPIVDAGRQRA